MSRLTFLALSVSDLERPLHFYRDVLGLPTVLAEPRDEPWGRTARYLDPDGHIVSITQA